MIFKYFLLIKESENYLGANESDYKYVGILESGTDHVRT
jgi:hypothetical protein